MRVFVTSVVLATALGAAGCLAPPIETGEPACTQNARAPSDPALGVRLEAASDGFETCASCEPRCFRMLDTLRSWDVEARGAGGLVFDPSVGGATSPQRPVPCETFPCATTYEYVDGASFTRTYVSNEPIDAPPCSWSDGPPLWGRLDWDATLPPGTSIELQFRGADHEPVPSEPIATFVITEGMQGLRSVAEVLLLAGATGRVVQSWVLQITAVLHPSPDRRHAPVLRELSLEVVCLPDSM